MASANLKIIKSEAKAARQAEAKAARQVEFHLLSQQADFLRIPTGIAPFDLYTNGGIPRGTTTLITGTEGAGKSTLASCAIAGFHKLDPKGQCYYVNAENKLDTRWLAIHGCDLERIGESRPVNTEEAQYAITEVAAAMPKVRLVVVDSLAALCPEIERVADPFDDHMMMVPKKVNGLIRKLTLIQQDLYHKGREFTVILINQQREKPGQGSYPIKVIPGGKAQRFHAALWCEFLQAEVKFEKKLKIPQLQTLKFHLTKNLGGASKYAGEVDMCITPFGQWRPGQFLDHEFTANWAKSLGVLRNRGSKGWEYHEESKPISGWVEAWEQDPAAYSIVKQDVQIAFRAWLGSKHTLVPEEA